MSVISASHFDVNVHDNVRNGAKQGEFHHSIDSWRNGFSEILSLKACNSREVINFLTISCVKHLLLGIGLAEAKGSATPRLSSDI